MNLVSFSAKCVQSKRGKWRGREGKWVFLYKLEKTLTKLLGATRRPCQGRLCKKIEILVSTKDDFPLPLSARAEGGPHPHRMPPNLFAASPNFK